MNSSSDSDAAAGGGGGGGPPPFVCIYASQVAMCIGANKHKSIGEAAELMWQRVAPAGFRAAMRRNNARTEDELAADIIRSHAGVRELVDLTLASECESSDQVAEQYDSLAKELRAVPLPEEDRRLVDDVLKRNLYTSYGNTHEHSVLGYIRDTLGIRCREDPTFYKRRQGTVCAAAEEEGGGGFPWYVGGKIDAIDEDRTLLIEVKNRVNRLFYRVPFYEQVQVQAYLHLLDLDQAVLVECLKTKHTTTTPAEAAGAAGWGGCSPAPADPAASPAADRAAADERFQNKQPPPCATVNVIPIRRDRELWEREIVPKLDGFVDFLARLMRDPALQDRFLQSKRRSAMVAAHVKSRKNVSDNNFS